MDAEIFCELSIVPGTGGGGGGGGGDRWEPEAKRCAGFGGGDEIDTCLYKDGKGHDRLPAVPVNATGVAY